MEEEVDKDNGRDMTPKLIKDLGMRYPTEKSTYKKRYGLYECQYCGKEWETISNTINTKSTKSCGCQNYIGVVKHGLTKHRLYGTWRDMITRCNNIKNNRYKDYGGRGIRVCTRWLDVVNFMEDMSSSYVEGLSLDRIDVNGDYEPENCRWASAITQQRNTKDIQTNNTSGYRGVAYSKASKKWSSAIKINYKSIYLGLFDTAIEAAKAYETYVRLNNLEHNFTPALSEEEILALEGIDAGY